MKITSHQLAAFYETAKSRSFSKAAGTLAVTQSALSQRIANLEDDLETTLFIRDPSGLRLTESGEVLLRYCQTHSSLEEEVLGHLKSTSQELRGTIRIAGFSSVLRSVIIPSLTGFLRSHPRVHCEFRSYEVVDLPRVLKSLEADLVVLDYRLSRQDVVEHILGREEYVVIESARHSGRTDVYLDHGPHDNATESYFAQQPEPPASYRRSFMGDVYGIIDGVEAGLGRAVMSKHMIHDNKKIKILKYPKRYFRDVTLNYFAQPYYSRLHREVVEQIHKNSAGYL